MRRGQHKRRTARIDWHQLREYVVSSLSAVQDEKPLDADALEYLEGDLEAALGIVRAAINKATGGDHA